VKHHSKDISQRAADIADREIKVWLNTVDPMEYSKEFEKWLEIYDRILKELSEAPNIGA
jgi:hypothetical protein